MKRRSFLFLILVGLLSAALFLLTRGAPAGMYANMHTSKGKIVFRLHYDKVPLTVANFLALAEGSHGLVQGDRKGVPFYDGLTFHKLIPEVMIQGGDPKGTGNGGPGFRFARELSPDLGHDRPGILSTLNEGPFSHGSQFFITLTATPRYDGRHAVFGEVVRGLSVLEQLVEGDTLEHLSIRRIGKDAAAFDLAEHLEALGRSASHAEQEAGRLAHEAEKRSTRVTRKLALPKLTGNTDPDRLPKENQPEDEKIALEYLLVSHKDALLPVGKPKLDREEALHVARHLAALAREKGTDFEDLAREFSDSSEFRIPLLLRDSEKSRAFLPCFRLKPGQVSDPIRTPKGFMVVRRVALQLIHVRHILISYEGAHGSTQTRTQQEARDLAEKVLRKAHAGDDFAALARKHSDSTSAGDGGLIGEIARGMTVPAFDHAAFSLGVGDVSNVTLSPSGYQIIQRIK